MDSYFKPQVTLIKTENLPFNALPDFCTMPLKMAQAKKFTINEGQILIQSVTHYLVQIQLVDYYLTHDLSMDFIVSEPSFFLYVTLNQNSCSLNYRAAGKYKNTIPAGKHEMLLIVFRPEWLFHKCQRLPELKSFVAAFNALGNRQISLPSYGIAASLFKALKKIDTKTSHLNVDLEVYIFINSCINKYYNKLITKKTTGIYHHKKATAIAKFVGENFATEMVDDLPNLAARFMISERHLARLARMAFGIPLHTQVIKIRMNSGLNHLFTTDKSIHEISRLIGYREPYYFSKAFKKHFGVSPTCLGNR